MAQAQIEIQGTVNRLFRKVLGSVAVAGFLLSAAVHLSALSHVNLVKEFPNTWFLHVGIFVVFIPAFVLARIDFGSNPSLTQISATLPRWATIACIALIAYAAVNFLVFAAGTVGGSPDIRDGKYVLLDHGRLIREITASEYVTLKTNVVRGFSGHWLVFYFCSAAYLLLSKKRTP